MATSQYEQDKLAKKRQADTLKARQDNSSVASELNDNTIVLTTRKQKIENFWYHYKVHVIVGILLVAMATHLFISIFYKAKFDVTLNIVSEQSFEGASDYFVGRIDEILLDYDGDGKKKMNVNPMQVSSGANSNGLAGEALMANQAKLLSTTGDTKMLLYLVDQGGYDVVTEIGLKFKDLSEFNSANIQGDKYSLKDTKLSELLALDDMLDNMYLCIVDFENYDKKKASSQKVYDREYDFLSKLIEYN